MHPVAMNASQAHPQPQHISTVSSVMERMFDLIKRLHETRSHARGLVEFLDPAPHAEGAKGGAADTPTPSAPLDCIDAQIGVANCLLVEVEALHAKIRRRIS